MSATIGRRVDLLLRTGQLLVESAADTNRIVRNMKRVAAYLGIPEEKLHIDVSYTMLQVNVSDDQYSYTKFQKCEKHGINMSAISEVSKLSWRAIEEDYTLDRYEQELEQIRRKPRNYKPYLVASARDLPAAASASSSAATGLRSSLRRCAPSSDSASGRGALTSA